MMKALIVTPYFPPRKGGLENYAYNISKILSEKGHDITIFSSGNTKESYNFKVIRVNNKISISNTPLDFVLPKLSKLVKEEDFDLINAHMPVPFYADMAAIAARRNNIPFILTYHNDVVKEGLLLGLLASSYNKSLLQFTLRSADRIITPSPYVYNESPLIKNFADKTALIPPGVDPEKYKPGEGHVKKRYNLSSDSKIILFVGAMNRGHSHKGVDILLKAFSKIKMENVYLFLAGTGDMIPEYKKLAQNLGISERVVFTGFIDEESLIDLYRGSYMLILPTLTPAEGFGMVLIEANACGTPVIGSKIGGIKYVIKDGKTGLLVPPGDPEALAKAMQRLLEDDELTKKMGSKGKKMVEKNYTWDKSVKLTARVFEEVIL